MFDAYSPRLGVLFVLISIACGILSAFRYIRDKRFLESIIIFLSYFLPPIIYNSAKEPLSSLLKDTFYGTALLEGIADVGSMVLLSPIIIFWVFWLAFGGYALIEDNIDFID